MLSNFILRRSRVVKSLNFEPNVWRNWKFLDFVQSHPSHVLSGHKCQFFELNFQHESKFLDFAQFHPSQVRSGQTLDFRSNFQHDWKFLDFAKFNFILRRSGVVKNLIFEPNFQHKSKFFWIFVKFHPLLVWSGQNFHFWAKFLTRLKISGFCQILSYACPECSKLSNFVPNFRRDWKFLNFAKFHPSLVLSGQKCQFWAEFLTQIKISSFAGQVWSNTRFRAKFSPRLKISWFLPDFILRRSGLVKNVIFESNFQHKSKFFWILSNSILCWFGVVKTLVFEPNLQRDWKCLDFAKLHPLHALSVQNSQILCKIFSATKNVWIVPNFILRMSWVVKNVSSS